MHPFRVKTDRRAYITKPPQDEILHRKFFFADASFIVVSKTRQNKRLLRHTRVLYTYIILLSSDNKNTHFVRRTHFVITSEEFVFRKQKNRALAARGLPCIIILRCNARIIVVYTQHTCVIRWNVKIISVFREKRKKKISTSLGNIFSCYKIILYLLFLGAESS